MPYRPYIPRTLGDLLDLLGLMMLRAPTFTDKTGHFPERNIDTVFCALNKGLQANRGKLGEERYQGLADMSNQMRTYFEAGQKDEARSTEKGRELIAAMEDVIEATRSTS